MPLVQQVRLQAVTADNGHDFFLMEMTVLLLGFFGFVFYLACGESVSLVGAVVAPCCC